MKKEELRLKEENKEIKKDVNVLRKENAQLKEKNK
jgi:hypothetical protein